MTSIFGSITVETPKFAVVKALGSSAGAEVRRYSPQVRAEVLYDIAPDHGIMDGLNAPFRALAGYIFGGNTSRTRGASEKVAMTAPVVMQAGLNEGCSKKITMTAPVVMQTGAEAATAAESAADDKKRVMCFIMPSKYQSVADLPAPNDPRVRLFEVPERTFAAIRFHGKMGTTLVKAKEQELRTAAEKEGVKLSDDPYSVQYCAYNPPWCLPWFATNDILIPVME